MRARRLKAHLTYKRLMRRVCTQVSLCSALAVTDFFRRPFNSRLWSSLVRSNQFRIRNGAMAS